LIVHLNDESAAATNTLPAAIIGKLRFAIIGRRAVA
jgi:hypothetical protein